LWRGLAEMIRSSGLLLPERSRSTLYLNIADFRWILWYKAWNIKAVE
jgi:hypothetical protein